MNMTALGTYKKWNPIVFVFFMTGFINLEYCPQDSSMLQYVSEFPSFLNLIFHRIYLTDFTYPFTHE